MEQVTIFTTKTIISNDDLLTAVKAFGLPEIPTIKIAAQPETVAQPATAQNPEIVASPAVVEVLYTPEERNDLAREALKTFKQQQENKLASFLVDYIAKERDAQVRSELSNKAEQAIEVTLQNATI